MNNRQHRRWIITKLNDHSQELSHTEDILKLDAKNYHAWSHRQWAVRTYNLWENELKFAQDLITEDLSMKLHFISYFQHIVLGNNSAWNYRFFVIQNSIFDLAREIEYVLNTIKIAPNNRSPWNYLIG
jgi:protein farnesyltransferase/geranylgeranyltransferase type-1 subunit alpha